MSRDVEQFKEIINDIRDSYLKNELLLFSLFEVINVKEYENRLHEYAINFIKSDVIEVDNPLIKAIVLASLSVIGFRKYDGNFWDNVFDYYRLYDYNKYNRQSVENNLRNLVRSAIPKNLEIKRIINYVLMQTIVPEKYFYDFLEILDLIYKYDLRAQMPDELSDLDDVLHIIFNQISKKAMSNEDAFKSSMANKSYKLVQTTRDVINNGRFRNHLIKFSKEIIIILDDLYESKLSRTKNRHLLKLVEDFFNSQDKKDTKILNKEKFNWKSTFIFENNQLFLDTKSIIINNDLIFDDIYVEIFSNDTSVKIIEKPRIYNRDTSSELAAIRVPVTFNPFKIKIVIHGIEIQDQLIENKYLIFSVENGKRITNISNENEVLILFDKSSELFSMSSKHKQNELYNFTYINIYEDECFKLDNETICFRETITSKLIGDLEPFISVIYDNNKLGVYKNKPNLLLANNNDDDAININVNGQIETIIFDKNNGLSQILSIKNIKNGYNEISQQTNNHQKKNFHWSFYLDTEIEQNVDLNSGLLTLKMSNFESISVDIKHIKSLPLRYEINKLLHIDLIPKIPYVFDTNGELIEISNFFWIADYSLYGMIKIIGINKQNLVIKDELRNNISDVIKVRQTRYGPTFEFDISILKVSSKNGYLVFFDNYNDELEIPYLNYPLINIHDVHINSFSKGIKINISKFLGKNMCDVVIRNFESEKKLYDIDLTKEITIEIPSSIDPYQITLSHKKTIIVDLEYFHLTKDYLINKDFIIQNISYYKNYDSNLLYSQIKYTFIKIEKMLDNNILQGLIFYTTSKGSNITMNKIYPVSMQMLSDISDLDNLLLDVYFYDEDDKSEMRILFDESNKRILNQTDESNLLDINLIEDMIVKLWRKDEK